MKSRKLKFNYKITNYIDPKIIKIYVIILVSILLLAILSVVGLNIYRSGLERTELNKPELYSEEDISSILKSPGLTDFIIPETLKIDENSITLYREPIRKWTNEMVKHYIIPANDLGLDKISEESKKIIELKMDDIP